MYRLALCVCAMTLLLVVGLVGCEEKPKAGEQAIAEIEKMGGPMALSRNVEHPSPGWPDLPTIGFIAGRAATVEDLVAGRAVFASPEQFAPLQIDIPQYALFRATPDEVPRKVIVIQAESGATTQGGRMEILVLRLVDLGTRITARRNQVELLWYGETHRIVFANIAQAAEFGIHAESP